MPFRYRRATRVPSMFKRVPSPVTAMADTPRNRAARALDDASQWLDTLDMKTFRHSAATFSGFVAGVAGTLQMHQEAYQRGVARSEAVTGTGMFDSVDILTGEVFAAVRPIGLALISSFAVGWAIPLAIKATVVGTRCAAWGLREKKKERHLSQHAQRLKRLHGSLPSPPPVELPLSQSAARQDLLPLHGGATQNHKAPARPATKRGRTTPRKTSKVAPHGKPSQPTVPQIAASTSDHIAAPSQGSGSAAPLEGSALSGPGPLCDAGSLSKLTMSPRSVLLPRGSVSDSCTTPASMPASPASMPTSDDASSPVSARSPRVVSWEKQEARARRRARAAARAAVPPRPPGPNVTGLSYDNRVVVDHDFGLFWQSRDDYPRARLESMRPAPYKTVPHAHRHRPSPALRAAFNKVLRTRQSNGLRAQDIIDVLGRHGYHTYLVGGVVRDLLRNSQHPIHDVDLVTDAPTSEVQRLVHQALMAELPELQVTSSHVAHYQGVVSYGCIDVASIRVRGMFEPKRLNQTTDCRVYPLSFGTCLRTDAENRDLTCNAIYYDATHDLLLDPTGYGIADARNKHLRAPSAHFAMMNTTWALRYLKFFLRGYTPADAATKQLMMANADRCFTAPRFAHALERICEGSLEAWCCRAADALTAAGGGDLAQHIYLALPALISQSHH